MQNEAKTIIPEREKGNTADVVTSSDSFQKIRARSEPSRAAVVVGDAKLTADTFTRGWSVSLWLAMILSVPYKKEHGEKQLVLQKEAKN